MTSILLPTLEAEWMVTIGDALDLTGWAWIHHRPARRKGGKWTTPTQGNSSKGFPDIVAVRSPRVLWIEVKTNTGRTTPEQKQWVESLRSSGQEAHVLHFPRDWHRFDALIAAEPQQLTITNSSSVTDDLSLCGAALQVES
jgi:Holliday junction resolvase